MRIKYILFIVALVIGFQNYAQKKSDTLSFDGKTRIDIPQTNISIIPPAHFGPIKGQAGFMHLGSSSSIQIKLIEETPYTMVVKGLDKEYLEKQDVKFISKEDIKLTNGKPACLITVNFTITTKDKELVFERMMLFTGGYNHTIWINANYPFFVKKLLKPVIKESLLSVDFE